VKKVIKILLLILVSIHISLLNAQSVFDVIKSWNYSTSNLNWKAVTCGDINGDGVDEFIGIKTDTSQLIVFSSPTFNKTLNITGYLNQIDTVQNNFVGITVGKFIDYGDGTKQIAVLRKTTDTTSPNILIYRQIGYSNFQLVATGVSGSSSRLWIGCAAGDIDNDGLDELIVCKKDSSQFTAYSISTNGTWIIKGCINIDHNSAGPENDWKGIACHDYNNDGKADIIAVREGNSTYPDIVIWSFDSGIFKTMTQFNPGGTLHYNWNGIASGTFKSDGSDNGDFVLYKNSSPFFQFYHYNHLTNTTDFIGSNDFESDTNQPWFISSGNTDINNGRDEVIALRNYSSTLQSNIDMIGDKFWSTYDQVNMEGTRDVDFNFYPDIAEAFIKKNNIQTFDFLISDYFVRKALGYVSHDSVPDSSIIGSEYQNFISFLDATKNTSIKVWITLIPPTEANHSGTYHSGSFPKYTGMIKDSSGIIIDETTFFSKMPSTTYPDPLDFWDQTYGGWFKLCNLIAKQYPNFTGIKIDDFSRNLSFFKMTQFNNKSLLENMYTSLKSNNANISLIPINEWTGIANAPDIPPNNQPWWEPYTDGFIFPYCNMSSNPLPCNYDNSTTSTFYNEISDLKTWWNSPAKPIFTNIYASPLSCVVTNYLTWPTTSYIDTLMNYGKLLSDGVSIYVTQDPTTSIGCTVYTKFSEWANLPYTCDITVGINNPDNLISGSGNVRVFPIPASSNFTIEYTQPAIIEITNIHGQLLKTLALDNNNVNIDISSFQNGMYFVKVIPIAIGTEKTIEVKKFLKD